MLIPFLATPAILAESSQTRELRYRMKGKVRLLFFWVGKDEVGGGKVTIDQRQVGDGFQEDITVLFGSNPERVPGKINRWGFGREQAVWESAPASNTPRLDQTVFEGFIKHSKEKSLSEVRSNQKKQGAGDPQWFDGIRSTVRPETALSEIRIFSTAEDFDFRNATPIVCSYQDRLRAGPPDEEKKRDNSGKEAYREPFGFLTGLRHMIDRVVTASRSNPVWTKLRPKLRYVYHAQTYELRIRDISLKKKFNLPLPEGRDGRDRNLPFQRVARIDLSLRKLAEKGNHDFSLWIPLEGDYQGLPIRIVDKPRWWLHVELNLEPPEARIDRPVLRASFSGEHCQPASRPASQ